MLVHPVPVMITRLVQLNRDRDIDTISAMLLMTYPASLKIHKIDFTVHLRESIYHHGSQLCMLAPL